MSLSLQAKLSRVSVIRAKRLKNPFPKRLLQECGRSKFELVAVGTSGCFVLLTQRFVRGCDRPRDNRSVLSIAFVEVGDSVSQLLRGIPQAEVTWEPVDVGLYNDYTSGTTDLALGSGNAHTTVFAQINRQSQRCPRIAFEEFSSEERERFRQEC